MTIELNRLKNAGKHFFKKKPILCTAMLAFMALTIVNVLLGHYKIKQKYDIEAYSKELEKMERSSKATDLKKATEDLSKLKKTLESKLLNFSEDTRIMAILLSFEDKNKVKIENPSLVERYNLTKKTKEDANNPTQSLGDLYSISYTLRLTGEYKGILGYLQQLQQESEVWLVVEELKLKKANNFSDQTATENISAPIESEEAFKERLKAYEAQQILQADLKFKVFGWFQ